MKEITIKLSKKDINAIEDIFFCENTKEQYEEIRPHLVRIWTRICKQID